MRGLTIVLMIMVNTGLWGTPIAPALHHSLWNGMTPADVVFPWFMFIMGVSISYSFRSTGYRMTRATGLKIARRTLLIFVIGVALDFVEKGISGVITSLDFSNVRLTGVLARLAFSYGLAACIALCFSRRTTNILIVALLSLYTLILLLFDGYEPSVSNIISRVDVAVFGELHIYHDWVPGGRIAFDPEGLLGLIPSVAHVLIGYVCGLFLQQERPLMERITPLLLIGGALTIVGFGLDTLLPINKKVWSPTFVLVCCGLGATMLGLLIWALDIRRVQIPSVVSFCCVFGTNPLFLYIFSSLLGCLLWRMPSPMADATLPGWLYTQLSSATGTDSCLPSLIYSLLVVGICYMVGALLYRRKVIIKI